MMDLLLEHQKSPLEIGNFLAEVFECTADKIKIYSLDEFNSLTEELDAYAWECICIFSFVQGDASQLLQLYKYRMSNLNVIQRLTDIALKHKIHMYIPNDSLDTWVYVDDVGPKYVRQMESDVDNCFYFSP